MIKFGGGLVINRRPACGPVEAHTGPAIMTTNHTLRIARIDPEIVIVAVWDRNLREGLPTIYRLVTTFVEHPERLGVLGIGINMLVVPGTLAQILFVRESLPGSACVI